jgi:elongation factor G
MIPRSDNLEVNVGVPAVAYRETISHGIAFDYQRRLGGIGGRYARVMGRIEPCEEPFVFENQVADSTIPMQFIAACEKGFCDAIESGFLIGCPVTGVKVILEGGSHDVNSSEMLFRIVAKKAFQDAFRKARPIILESIMLVEVETPNEFVEQVQDDLMSRYGFVMDLQIMEGYSVIRAEVPLKEMFGYSTDLPSLTSGQANFLMEFSTYRQVSASEQTQLIAKVAQSPDQ